MAAEPDTPDRTPPAPPAASGTAALPPPPPGASPVRKKPSIADIFVSLKMRDFRYLTLSTLAAGFAQWAKQLALFALAYDMTGSAMQLATVAAFRGIVGTVVAPFGGYLSDRYPRRAVIVLSTALDVALAATLAALVIADVAAMWHVYAIALGGGLAQSINQPARQAFVYDVTTDETLQNAIAVNSMVQNISRVLGPSGVGVMMAVWGVASALVALVGLQLVAIVATLQISRATRQVQAERGSAASKMMSEGFRYCWEDKRILGLVVVGTIPSLLVYPYIPFLKIISEEVLNQGNAGFGMLSSMMGWGSLIGLFALAYLGRVEGRGRLMLGCYLVYGTLLVGFSASSTYVLSLSILAIGGIFHSVAMALNNTLLLQSSRAEMRGRVMAVNQMTHGIQPLGSFLMGLAITGVGVQMGIGIFMASATVLFALFAVVWGSVRRM